MRHRVLDHVGQRTAQAGDGATVERHEAPRRVPQATVNGARERASLGQAEARAVDEQDRCVDRQAGERDAGLQPVITDTQKVSAAQKRLW